MPLTASACARDALAGADTGLVAHVPSHHADASASDAGVSGAIFETVFNLVIPSLNGHCGPDECVCTVVFRIWCVTSFDIVLIPLPVSVSKLLLNRNVKQEATGKDTRKKRRFVILLSAHVCIPLPPSNVGTSSGCTL